MSDTSSDNIVSKPAENIEKQSSEQSDAPEALIDLTLTDNEYKELCDGLDGCFEFSEENDDAPDEDRSAILNRFREDQISDIRMFERTLDSILAKVAEADYSEKVKLVAKNISPLRFIARNSTGLLAFDEVQHPDDAVYAAALVMIKLSGASFSEELADLYGEMDVWDYIPE